MEYISIRRSRIRRLISSTSSSRIIHSQMGTNVSVHCSSCGSSNRINIDFVRMDYQKSMNQDSSLSLSWLQHLLQVRRLYSSDSWSILLRILNLNLCTNSPSSSSPWSSSRRVRWMIHGNEHFIKIEMFDENLNIVQYLLTLIHAKIGY